MKKKLLSIIATAMSICMGVSFFAGCNQGGDSSSSAKLPTTEDEILAYVLAAIETSANYDGAYTYTMNKRTVDNTGMPIGEDAGFLRTTTTKKEGTVDVSAAKKLVKSEVDVFKKNGEEESTTFDKTTYKLFQARERTLSYTQRNETEAYEILQDSQVKTQLLDLSDAVKRYKEYCQLPALPSVAQMNEAYATVYSEVSQMISRAGNVMSGGKATISCEETEKGYVLTSTIEEKWTTAYEATQEITQTKLQTSVTAQEGKIVSLQVEEKILSDTLSKAILTEPMIWEAEASYDISYTFNQEEYDKVQTAPPWHTLQDSIQDKTTSKAVVDIYINGYLLVTDYKLSISEVNGIASPLRVLEQTLLYPVRKITWYSDPECTKPIEPTRLKEEDFAQIPALYGQGTFKDGDAFFETESNTDWADDVSDACKAVFAQQMASIQVLDGTKRNIWSRFYPPYESDRYQTITTFVNGELYSPEDEFVIETGAYYKVQHNYEIKTGYFFSLHYWISVR